MSALVFEANPQRHLEPYLWFEAEGRAGYRAVGSGAEEDEAILIEFPVRLNLTSSVREIQGRVRTPSKRCHAVPVVVAGHKASAHGCGNWIWFIPPRQRLDQPFEILARLGHDDGQTANRCRMKKQAQLVRLR